MTAQVFISYSTRDKFFAELLTLKLEGEELTVWRDVNSLRAGDEWRSGIDAGIGDASVVVFVVTKASCESHYVTYEWASAMGKGRPILPILLEDCNRHPKIEELQYLDFRHHNDSSWQQVVRRIEEILSGKEEPERSEKTSSKAASSVLSASEAVARDKIKAYLIEKGFRMVSLDRVREKIDPNYTDPFLKDLTEKADEFAVAYLKGPKVGIKLR